jgi:hypothetical protein
MLLVLLVGVSAALRVWASEAIARPWINPDELIYTALGRALWHTGHLTLFGARSGFYSFLYPALAGLPLSLHDAATGYRLLQAAQAFAMSLAAVPTYLWARRLASRDWALVAAALALVPPGLALTGLVMTEVLFYPALVLAAWATWTAVVDPTLRAQAVAVSSTVVLCSIRLQGFVVALAYVVAVVLRPSRLRAHVPAIAAFVALAAVWSGWELRHGGPLSKVFGAYAAAGEAHYRAGAVARFVLYDLGDVVLIVGVVPALAVLLLARVREPLVRAYVVVALSVTAWLVLQVAAFASVHVGNPAERNLFGVIPLFAVGLVAWLQRNAPRSAGVFAAVACACVALLIAFPFQKFASLAATPSNFTLVPLYEVRHHVNVDVVVPIVAAALAALAFTRPRITVPLLFALGIAASVATSRFVAKEVHAGQLLTLGADTSWIDGAADEPVAFVFSDDVHWETVWENTFWNRRLRDFYTLPHAFVPGGLPQRSAGPLPNGRLVLADGAPARASYAVSATNTVEVAGTAEATSRGLTLWKVDPPLRLVRWIRGLDTSSEALHGRVHVDAFACHGGSLHVAVRAGRRRTVRITHGGVGFGSFVLEPNVERLFTVPARPTREGLCRFTLRADGPFSTRGLIVF